jgi:hypothetical protein
MGFWRGAQSGVDPTTYTFSQAPTLISGCASGTVSGNTLSITGNINCSGILQFTGSISSLSVETNASAQNSQVFTMATFQGSDPEPVPGPLPLLGAGGAFAWSRRLRRRRKVGGRLS